MPPNWVDIPLIGPVNENVDDVEIDQFGCTQELLRWDKP